MKKILCVMFFIIVAGAAVQAEMATLALYRCGELQSPPAPVGSDALPLNDSSGNDLHLGTYMGQTWGGGPVTYSDDVAARLTGYSTRSYEIVHNGFWEGAASSYDWPDDNIGIEGWIKTAAASGGQSYGDIMFALGNPNEFATWRSGGKFFAKVNGTEIGHTAVPDWTWVHLALIRMNGTNTLYFNGQAVASLKTAEINLVGGHQFERDSGWVVWTGLTDEIRFFRADPNTFNPVVDLQYNNIAVMAWNPAPANGATEVPVATALSWNAGRDPNTMTGIYSAINGHGVYIGANAAAVAAATPATADIFKGYQAAGTTTYAAALATDTTYYWRVDERLGSDAKYVKGQVWSFRTASTKPVITQQPQNQGALAGENVNFSVQAYDPLGGTLAYKWYKQGVGALSDNGDFGGTATPMLQVINVAGADSGSYYCIVTSDSALSTTSASAQLVAGAIIGRWPFDGNPNDVIGSANASAGTGQYVAGVKGQAMVMNGTAVIIPTTTWSFSSWSASFWENANSGTTGYIICGGPSTGFEDLYLRRYPAGDGLGYAGVMGYAQGTVNGWPIMGPYAPGDWHHVVITFDAVTGVGSVYVDGQLAGDDNTVVFNGFTGGTMYLANRKSGGRPYSGHIDDLRVYDFSLPASKVLDLYTEVKPLCTGIAESDFNGDCVVDFKDFLYLVGEWMACGQVPNCM